MSVLKTSWSNFTREIAKVYLNGFGSPSPRSKVLMASVLKEVFGERSFTIADFGCGNGHLADFFREQGLDVEYHGYDFSTSLLQAGRERFEGSPRTQFFEADIEDPELCIAPCNVVLFSHVLEILQSPQKTLLAAKRNAPLIMIRFFEPPVGEFDVTQLLQMNTGSETTVPYLRRTMSAAYYNLILHEIGCRSVEVHQVDGDKDQVHLLRFEQSGQT
jgi:ubiquinone/menaquinone biosynthesis C-methylase UbiE